MARATWNGAVIAESDDYEVVEGNVYFPPGSVRWDHLHESAHTTACPRKGRAKYYDVEVDGETNRNAAWSYREPKEAAAKIKDYVAFWKGVSVAR